MFRTNLIVSIAGGVCLAATALSAAAQAVPLREGFSSDPSKVVLYTSVPYSEVDLTSTDGAWRLLQRIADAADAVCGGEASRTTAYDNEHYLQCRGEAISGAVARARSPVLAELDFRRRMEARAVR
jgi:UrcA family protein